MIPSISRRVPEHIVEEVNWWIDTTCSRCSRRSSPWAAGGVEIYVCDQALAHHGFGTDEGTPEVIVAASAAPVNINLQLD